MIAATTTTTGGDCRRRGGGGFSPVVRFLAGNLLFVFAFQGVGREVLSVRGQTLFVLLIWTGLT
jgi:hypothetical protein